MRDGTRPRHTPGGFKVIGIPVRLHWSLLVIVGLLAAELATGLFPGGGILAVAGGVVLAGLLFASVLAHELGHSVVARHEGVEVDGITLFVLGGVSRLRTAAGSPGAAFRIAVAGPVVSFGLASGFAVLAATGGALALPGAVIDALVWLAFVNGVLGVFNLIPAAPLDGGRILSAALWAHHGDQWRATATAARAGRVVGWGLIALGAVGLAADSTYGGLWPMLLGWFVLTAAKAEERTAVARRDLAGVLVRDVMRPDPRVAPGWLTVDGFADRWRDSSAASPAGPTATDGAATDGAATDGAATDGAATDGAATVVPVARWEGEIVGVVTPARLAAVPAELRHTTRVLDVAVPLDALRVARPEEPLADVLARPGVAGLVLVFEGSRLVGLVHPADVIRATAAAATRGRALRPASAQL